ncbi:ATP-binding protein [Collinsella intestinalis]|uniref:ATP-binding protein n=1 Tax=Collinsella intestinalis TaxID=147207 RepID=UPI0019585CC5|nr:ATP-binding protein [Collinsella intestinalis]MBM6908053.1 ATP-binding protein [Collinsella intestinalis]
MLEDIIERATEAADDFVERPAFRRITSVTVPKLFGATWEYRDPSSGNWRTRMNKLLGVLSANGIGLLVTIDEVDPSLDELIDFAAAFQYFVREQRDVALFMAGLPAHVSALLSDKSASFLRRAAQHSLGRIADHDVRDAFQETVEDAGRLDDEALDIAVAAADGFAYMMQLVGFRAWASMGDAKAMTAAHARRGAVLARQDFINGVVKKTCQELSDGDMAFLEAMLADEGRPSLVADIAERMGKSANYARVYRTRLLEQGVIDVPRRGYVTFEMPLLREYLSGDET